jgi:hypothetical protein
MPLIKNFFKSWFQITTWSALRWTALMMILIVTGAFTWGYLVNQKSERQVAIGGPVSKLHPFPGKQAGKANGFIDVRVSAPNGVPDSDQQELVLQAEVTLNGPSNEEVNYYWNLPEDAKVVSGNVSDSWTQLKTGEKALAEIRLLNVSNQTAKVVSFHAMTLTNGARMGGIDSFSTSNHEANQGVKKEKLSPKNNQEPKLIY